MKKTLFSLVLMLTASISYAETMNASSVCQKIAQVNSDNAGACNQLIARNSLDQRALKVAYWAEDSGSASAIAVLSLDDSVQAVEEILATPVI